MNIGNRYNRCGLWGIVLWLGLYCFMENSWAGGPLSHLYFPSGRPDTVMFLYGPDNRTEVVAVNNDLYPGSLFSGITVKLLAEKTYFIKISPAEDDTRDNSGYYRISLAGPGSSSIFRVPSDTVELKVGDVPYLGYLKNSKDQNLYIFRTAEAGEYTISTWHDPDRFQPGVPNRWKSFPVLYHIDRGPLGDVDEDTAVDLVRNCAHLWNDVSTSSFRFEEGPRLSSDFDRSTLGVAPLPRRGHVLFYDPIRKKNLVFGGYSGSSTYGDMWEWDGIQWQEMKLSVLPGKREAFGYTYDTTNRRHILFGGYGESSLLNDMWSWDGVEWKELTPAKKPSARIKTSMAFDENRGEIVLFGGLDYNELYGDTWVWNGQTWTKKMTPTAPSPRIDHRLFYDPVLRKVILFGGYDGSKTFRDMWSWDGSKWTKITFTQGPSARDAFAVTFDSQRQVTLLFGGMDSSSQFLNDLWSWNGSKWTEITAADRPSPRQYGSLTYDPEKKHIVLFGGEFGDTDKDIDPLGDTWAWNGETWVQLHKGAVEFIDYVYQLHDQGFNPVIFDNRGELTELVMGEGSKEEAIGVAFSGKIDQGELKIGRIILNGWFVSDECKYKLPLNELANAIAHEFGHLIGLGHSQYYGHLRSNSLGSDDAFTARMYPFSGEGDDFPPVALRYDDLVSLSTLYPSDDGVFERTLGSISGKALFQDGTPVLGGIVVARLVSDRLNTVVSRCTDELAAFTGDFLIPGLPPGQYEVWIEAANPSSSGASDVGYHAVYEKGPAFLNPPRPEYYNGRAESGNPETDNPSYLSLVEVSAGQDTPITFICEKLGDKKERTAQILAYGSPMLGGINGKKRAHYQNPFSIVVTDSIADLQVSITPHAPLSYGIRIDRDQEMVYSGSFPLAREDACLVYDRNRKRFILFGGQSETGLMNDMWEWDGSQWTWIPYSGGPELRKEFALAFDEQRNQVVLFGGVTPDAEYMQDTWIWDGVKWEKKSPAVSPPARYGHTLTFHSKRKSIILFGGFGKNKEYLNDLWEWDGHKWIAIPAVHSPAGRLYGAMAYDSDRDRLVLFGGGDKDNRLNDTWEWDGMSWQEIKPASAPEPRVGQSVVYDPKQKKVFLFGGRTEEVRLNDMWEYQQGQWKRLILDPLPSPRSATLQCAYDSDLSRMVIYGGIAADDRTLGDIWEFDGQQWYNVSPIVTGFQGDRTILLSRSADSNPRLESGTYYMWVYSLSPEAGAYSIVVRSSSVENVTQLSEWELY